MDNMTKEELKVWRMAKTRLAEGQAQVNLIDEHNEALGSIVKTPSQNVDVGISGWVAQHRSLEYLWYQNCTVRPLSGL